MVNTNNSFNESNRKNYKVQFDNGDLFYYLSLTSDQVRLLDWLKEYGYDIDYEEQAEVIVI